MTRGPLVALTSEERDALVEVMGDIQRAVVDYYRATIIRDADIGTAVRTYLAKAQALHELLWQQIDDRATYVALFSGPVRHPKADLVEAIKYARNLSQHVIHPVSPREDSIIGGGTWGYRVYAYWDDVPAEKHAKLHARTQGLKPLYDAELLGHEVVSTMLPLLQFYAEANPDLIHRDNRGEWTGFPLLNHPAVSAPLHPEEPLNVDDAWRWLDDRRPGGDVRVVCAQVTHDGVHHLCGFTFTGRHSFAPFIETADRVRIDLDGGYPYLAGDLGAHTQDATGHMPRSQGRVLWSTAEVTSWATRSTGPEALLRDEDWSDYGDLEQWRRCLRQELPVPGPPKELFYGERRGRRLNALGPP